jgi:hypothetical protein
MIRAFLLFAAEVNVDEIDYKIVQRVIGCRKHRKVLPIPACGSIRVFHVKPQLMCYLVATEDYYVHVEQQAVLDFRSIDNFSPLIYLQNGFEAISGTDLLVAVCD